jgi:hypothetical protein
MSEDPAPYGNELVDGPWSVRWSVQLDENPVALILTERDAAGRQSVLTLPLTAKQAELIHQALGQALEQLKWKQPDAPLSFVPITKDTPWPKMPPIPPLRFDGETGGG